MKLFLNCWICALSMLVYFAREVCGQEITRDIAYSSEAHPRKKLDVYAPTQANKSPVVVWIHGGGWQMGDKSEVHRKPEFFTNLGYVFVSANYRLLPNVDMQTIVDDVAEAIGWVYENISKHGGDPERIIIMGHSAGAQLAALICTDSRYLGRQSVPISAIKLCVPVDGDTYDIPAMIDTAENRQKLHGLPLPEYGHRVKFGDDPALHRHFSAVSHLSRGQPVPRFLILHVSGHPDVTAQALRLREAILKAGGVATSFAAYETTHNRINSELGAPETDTTKALLYTLKELELPSE